MDILKMTKSNTKEFQDEIPDLTIYEISRRNMVAFCKHFIENDNLTKDRWWEIQREELDKLKQEIEKK